MHTEQKIKKRYSLLALIIFLIITIAVFWYIGRPMISFLSEPESFRQWVNSHGIWSRVIFIGMMALQVVIAFIPGEPLEISAGYAFGSIEGTILCQIGALLGSIIVYSFVKFFGIKVLEVFFPIQKIRDLRFIKDSKKLTLLTTILFLIPGTPKDILTYFVGLTPMKLRTWMLITFFARIPSIITSTIGGDALGIKNYSFAIILFVITTVMSLLGILIFHILSQKRKAKSY